MTHPALLAAPRDKRAAGRRIIKALKNGRLGAQGEYENEDGKCCAIGVLFTQQQRAWIRDKGMNEQDVDGLIDGYSGLEGIGEENFYAMTRLSREEASEIQGTNDERPGALEEVVREITKA